MILTSPQVTSLIPGRVRVLFSIVRRNPSFAQYLSVSYHSRRGICSLSANSSTGKILIVFEEKHIRLKEILSFLEEAWQSYSHLNSSYGLDLQRFAIGIKGAALQSDEAIDQENGQHLSLIPRVDQSKNSMGQELVFPGLHDVQAREQRAKYGLNLLAKEPPATISQILIRQSKDLLVQVHLGVILLTCLLGRPGHAVLTTVIVGINLGIGVFQELHTERSAAKLETVVEQTAKVRRAGRVLVIKAEDLVPGDIIEIEAGDQVPADAHLLSGSTIEVEEAILSGEAIPVIKTPRPAQPAGCGQQHTIFMGTNIVRGRALAEVVSTGMNTEMGKISGLITSARQDLTPLQQRLEEVGQHLVYSGLGIAGFLLAVGCLRGRPFIPMLHNAASLAVAIIPEGLNPIVLIAMAIGVRRIAKRNGIVRKLSALETLGGVTIICSDKTGTLTQNQMAVQEVYSGGYYWKKTSFGFTPQCGQGYIGEGDQALAAFQQTLLAGVLCNNASFKCFSTTRGAQEKKEDPTEVALIKAAAHSGIDTDCIGTYKRLRELPFESERRLMSVICSDHNGSLQLFTKGSADSVLERCTHYLVDNTVVPLNIIERNKILEVSEKMAVRGLRVLASGFRETSYDELVTSDTVEGGLVFCGLFGLIDPPRVEAIGAIAKCQDAGIRVMMITGDHPSTAAAIAHQLRLGGGEPKVMLGEEIDKISDRVLAEAVSKVDIFARAHPNHKLRIVRALKDRGEIVAMTGDGINDAPALKEAHVGIAMGTTGTDVTKGVAGLVLVDDNFATIVSAVEEGRGIAANIRNSMRYLIAANVGEVILLLAAIIFGMPCPLLPLQLLNLVGDGLPAVSLANDPPAKEIMKCPPRDAQESVFADSLASKIMSRGIALGFMSLLLYSVALGSGRSLASVRTMVLSQLAIGQLIHVFDCRWESQKKIDSLKSNPALLASVSLSVALIIAAIHIPGLRSLFVTTPLRGREWLTVFATAVFTIPMDLAIQKGFQSLNKHSTVLTEPFAVPDIEEH